MLLVVNKRTGRDCGLGPLTRLDGARDGAGDTRGTDIMLVTEWTAQGSEEQLYTGS